MAINVSTQFNPADVEAFLANETLPLVRRRLVAFQFGDPLELPKGRGVTYTAVRFNRLSLPPYPLSEGVPPIGQTMTLATVTATAVQWGDKVTLTDIAEMTIKHPLFQKAKELCTLAVAETLERNTYNALNAGTQVNYVNTRGSRPALQTGDVLNIHEVNRAYGVLDTLGAIRFMGDEQTNTKIDAEAGGAKASSDPRGMPHYCGIIHPLCIQDLRENATFVLASSYSDINRLYNFEVGEFGGVRFCSSQMVPFWTGYANTSYTAVAGSAGSLATNTYYVVVTGLDTQNQYESFVAAVSGAISVSGPSGSISVTVPSTPGYTYNVYVGLTNSPTNLGLSPQGPTVGPMTGQATLIPAGSTAVITALGIAQAPPAFPGNANGLTIYPSYIIGRGAYGQVSLDDIKYSYLDKADKSDVLNQLRVVGWKVMYGTIILNQQFFMRLESTSAFSATFG